MDGPNFKIERFFFRWLISVTPNTSPFLRTSQVRPSSAKTVVRGERRPRLGSSTTTWPGNGGGPAKVTSGSNVETHRRQSSKKILLTGKQLLEGNFQQNFSGQIFTYHFSQRTPKNGARVSKKKDVPECSRSPIIQRRGRVADIGGATGLIKKV